MPQTDEQSKAYIAALEEELAGYEAKGLDDRAKQVVAELERVGGRKKVTRSREG